MAHSTRQGGTWRNTVQPSVCFGGTWRAASAAWIRKAGAWEQWWPNLPDRGGPYLYGSISSCGPNICHWDGSVWIHIGGGLASAVGAAALNDAGHILASSTSGKYWDGSSWNTIAGMSPSTHVRSDGSTFLFSYPTPGSNPVYVKQFQPPSSIGTIIQFSDTTPFGYSYLRDLAFSQFSGGYAEGNFNSPSFSPAAFDMFGSSGPFSVSYGQLAMNRQLDGNVWAGALAGGYITKENGALNTWTVVGGVIGGGNTYALCALPDGRAWAGGDFTSINGVSIAGLAEWNGSAWVSIGSVGLVRALSFHRGLLWILAGATSTTCSVYTWDGSTLALQSNWTGDDISGML